MADIPKGSKTNWTWEAETISGAIVSNPPSEKCKVTNIYVNPITGKLIVEYDNTPIP